MSNLKQLVCAAAASLMAAPLLQAQLNSPAPATLSTPIATVQPAAPAASPATTKPADNSLMLVQATAAPLPAAQGAPGTATTPPVAAETMPGDPLTESGGVGVREFQGDDVGQVLRLLARQAKINMVVSDQIPPGTTVTMRLEDVTALQAIAIIVKAKSLFMDKIENVYYIKTAAERTAEPTESDSYQFSYSRAKETAPLIAAQLQSKDAPQIDERTNTIFYRETRSNIDAVRKLLVQIDKPTKQVMIEARLVEVNANPTQSYGINWAGVVGSASNPQTLKYGGTTPASFKVGPKGNVKLDKLPEYKLDQNGNFQGNDFLRDSRNGFAALAGQFAILSIPQMSIAMSALNEDSDAEFLANPRVVTADNMQAKIEITRNQPVPKLNFNEQTATAVFGGFEDKKFGNTLIVKPLINKDDFITLSVKPEISNKVFDQPFSFAGATVTSPVIDTRTLDSNVLIKSGDTLAIGGLLQDETNKARTKVPIMGDIPVLGYLFQSKTSARVKRNLLVFVTPTIIDQRYGTGLEDQVNGVHHSGEEYADPNGWRNNAKGAVRLVPTPQRQIAADYPKPGIPPAPARSGSSEKVRFITDAKDRDF